jgi:hypothetical protein
VTPRATTPVSRGEAAAAIAAQTDGPSHGDVVVAPDDSGPRRRYTLAQVPGRTQLRWATRDGAEAMARRFAAHHGVDVWIRGSSGLTRLATHRMPHPAVNPIAAASPPRD